MIIFYHKKNKNIFGVVEGRYHDNPEAEMIKPNDVKDNEVGKYIVPYKPLIKTVSVPIKKLFLVDEKTKEVEERIVGHRKTQIHAGLTPDTDFNDLILSFENKKEDIFQYKVKLDKLGNVIGFIKSV